MRMFWFGGGGIAGNVTDALSYLEPLHEQGHELEINLVYSKSHQVSFEESYKLLETTIPLECFKKVDSPSLTLNTKDRITFTSAPGFMDKVKPLHFCKAIFPLTEREQSLRGETRIFAPTRSLAEAYGYDHIPRPLKTDTLRQAWKEQKRYEIVDAVVANNNKRLDILNELSKSFRTKVAVIVSQKWQREKILSKCDNLDIIENASKSQVAKLMGNGKLLVHPAMSEQASCVLDEALLAGCLPILRRKASLSYEEQSLGYAQYFGPASYEPNINRLRLNGRVEEGTYGDLASVIGKALENYDPHLSKQIASSAYNAKSRDFLAEGWLKYVEGIAKTKMA